MLRRNVRYIFLERYALCSECFHFVLLVMFKWFRTREKKVFPPMWALNQGYCVGQHICSSRWLISGTFYFNFKIVPTVVHASPYKFCWSMSHDRIQVCSLFILPLQHLMLFKWAVALYYSFFLLWLCCDSVFTTRKQKSKRKITCYFRKKHLTKLHFSL